jgi:hypothetical protein
MAQWLDRIKFGNGHDGSPAVSGTINSYATCTGTVTQTSLTTTLSASAGDVILIHQSQGTGAGQWEINYVLADAGATLTLAYPLAYTYGTGAQVVLVPQYTGGTLSGAVTGTSWNGSVGGIIALMSNGDLTVSGTLSVNYLGFRGASGVGVGSGIDGKQGEGYGSSTYNATSYNYNYNGGGGGDYQINQAGGGGGGGNGTAGSTAPNSTNAIEGIGGIAAGNADLTSIVFGGGGGSACTGNDGNGQSGPGGTGGGAIFIFGKNITVSGSITSNGSNGSGQIYASGGSGGGAGGSIIIKCQGATIGTNKILASAGAGGTTGQGYGGDGAVGRIHVDYSDTVSGTTTPTLDSTQDTTLKVQPFGGMI